jgi:predicted metal-dependent HD superfamily phosphohydrolase
MEQYQEFLVRFRQLCMRLGGEMPKADAWFGVLWANYEEPGRAYHTMKHHIRRALEQLDAGYPVEWGNHDMIEFALWFHDVIYDGRRHDNERRSADMAWMAAEDIDVSNVQFHKDVEVLIMATTHEAEPMHGPLYEERCWITDIDLQGLGSSPEEFDENGRLIRQEYAFATDEQYAEGRRAFAQKMLAREHIFSTARFRLAYESQARQNLERLAVT